MRALAVTVFAVLVVCQIAQGSPLPLGIGEETSVNLWLNSHRDYRLATDEDCGCASDLFELRTQSEGIWKAKPDLRPYFVSGDFRHNGHTDFAVIVVKRGEDRPMEGVLLIFDGPFAQTGNQPVYMGKITPLLGAGLILPPNSSWPVYGPWFTDVGCYYKPNQHSYRRFCGGNY